MGTPMEFLGQLPPDRIRQQGADEVTLRFIEYLKTEPAIRALITGHKHLNDEAIIGDRLPQYITGGSFDGYAREITFL